MEEYNVIHFCNGKIKSLVFPIPLFLGHKIAPIMSGISEYKKNEFNLRHYWRSMQALL